MSTLPSPLPDLADLPPGVDLAVVSERLNDPGQLRQLDDARLVDSSWPRSGRSRTCRQRS